MAYQAQVRREAAQLLILDDRGIPATQLELPRRPSNTSEADEPLSAAGWVRTGEWTNTNEGWQAPVVEHSSSS